MKRKMAESNGPDAEIGFASVAASPFLALVGPAILSAGLRTRLKISLPQAWQTLGNPLAVPLQKERQKSPSLVG